MKKNNNTSLSLSTLFETFSNMLPKHTERHIYESDKFDITFEDDMTIDEIRKCYNDAKELLDEIAKGREGFHKTIKFNKNGTISDWGCVSPNTDDRDECKRRNNLMFYSVIVLMVLACGTVEYLAHNKGGVAKWMIMALKA